MKTPAHLSWHVPAIVFFAAGAVAGCVFIGMGPFTAIRVLGLVALMSGLAGASLMMLTMQMENPAECDLLRGKVRIVVARMWNKPAEWSRTDVDRWTDTEHARMP